MSAAPRLLEETATRTLHQGARALVAVRGHRGPVLSPVAYWFDGASVWFSTPADSVRIAGLLRDPVCAVHVAAGEDAAPGQGTGAIANGRGRIFSFDDPRGLVLHSAAITAAVTALVTRHAAGIREWAQGAVRQPARLLPHSWVVVRMEVESARSVRAPVTAGGIAPALPTVVPSDVRRAVAGFRAVVVAVDDGGELSLDAATWSAGMALAPAEGDGLPVGAPAAVALDSGSEDQFGPPTGLALAGALAEGPTLRPVHVTWWQGFRLQSADLPPGSQAGFRSGLTLPD